MENHLSPSPHSSLLLSIADNHFVDQTILAVFVHFPRYKGIFSKYLQTKIYHLNYSKYSDNM